MTGSGFGDANAPESYLRFAIWLGRFGCGYGLALAYLARVLGTEGDIDSRLTSALRGHALTSMHDLRHSFASDGLLVDEGLPMTGKLLGHNDIETTARYPHLARDSVHEEAGRIADSIDTDIL